MNLNKYKRASSLEKLLKQKDAQCAELQKENEQLQEKLSKQEAAFSEIKANFQIAENNLKQCIDEYAKLKAHYQEMLKFMNKTSQKYVAEMKALTDMNHK